VRDEQLHRTLEGLQELAYARLFLGAEDGHESERIRVLGADCVGA